MNAHLVDRIFLGSFRRNSYRVKQRYSSSKARVAKVVKTQSSVDGGRSRQSEMTT